MICGVCGGSGTVLWPTLSGKFRTWFRPCNGLCGGTGLVLEYLWSIVRTNLIDWYGAAFPKTHTYFSGCAVRDERDEYEFALEAM